MSLAPARQQCLDFFGTQRVIEPSPGQLSSDAGLHFRIRLLRDPLGEGRPCTWRTLLIKVAAEVVIRRRRIVIRLSSSWPLEWYRRVCERLREPLSTPVANPSG